jgi:hypothetical protein
MKDTFYFSHDYNTRTDIKIKRLLAKTGYRGYGVFWAIIEDLYNNANALPTDYDGIAFDLREDADFVKQVICDYDLFVFEDGFFGSKSVERRLNERNEKSVKARQSALSRWNKCERNANALQTQSDGNAIKERKGKERKEKEIINPPTFDDFLTHCKTFSIYHSGYDFAIKAKYDSWVANSWKDGNDKPIKTWKNKIANTFPHLQPTHKQTENKPPTIGYKKEDFI